MDLVVLSACQTALGDRLGSGIEIIGFGYQLQLAQARASIATLWAINDTTTSDLMDLFYTRLKTDRSNPVHALRAAQMDLIRGTVPKIVPHKQTNIDSSSQPNHDSMNRRSLDKGPGNGENRNGINRNSTHPYYWAPFILIGNGF